MTRKEQIKAAALKSTNGNEHLYSFIDGALWADANPEEPFIRIETSETLSYNEKQLEAKLAIAIEALKYYSQFKYCDTAKEALEKIES